MKKLKILVSAIVIVISIFLITGCGVASIDYDCVAGGNTFTYTTVENMKDSPRNYINKTFKIRGKIKSNGSSYHYISGYDASNCCSWSLEVRANNIEFPETTKNVVAVGTYKSEKTNGKTSYFLEISNFE